MLLLRIRRIFPAALLLVAALWVSSCAAPLGPGYAAEKQSVVVHFVPGTPPRIEIRADYSLRNTGNQPLGSIEVRLPRESLLRLEAVSLAWDSQMVVFDRRNDPAGDVLHLNLNAPWAVKQSHTLHLEYDILTGDPNKPQLALSADSFYLPPNAWLAALLPPPGTFASGGVPPKEWTLSLHVPPDFLVHATGESKRPEKQSRGGALEFVQRTPGLSPFVVAGRYYQQEYRGSPYTVFVWGKNKFEKAEAESLASEVQQIAGTYDSLFGPRDKKPRPLWIVDSPVPAKEYDVTRPSAMGEVMVLAEPPPDFGFIHFSKSGGPILNQGSTSTGIAESLAKTWLGYGLGPNVEDQPYPVKAIPEYAVSIAQESPTGPQARAKTIKTKVNEYDDTRTFILEHRNDAKGHGDAVKFLDSASPLKSVLFFYALEDKFGPGNLHKALRHMVQARKGRGYELNDLIAALEQEAHQNVAEFVRLWMKHPGIPADFRARYAGQPAPPGNSSKETTP